MRISLARLHPGARAVALSFVISGSAHLVRPQVFDPLMPPALPAPRAWIAATGAAELASAGGLLMGARWAPAATAATLLVVWPGNWWYAIRVQRSAAPAVAKGAAWLRVPLQVPLIVAVREPYRDDSAG